jgi:cobalamin biosynthesis protein CbiD
MTNDPVLPLLAEWKNLFAALTRADERMIAAPKGSAEQDEFEAELDRIGDQISELEDQIARTRATSLAGIVGKMAIVGDGYARIDVDELDIEERLIATVFADLKALAAEAAP